VKTFLRYAITHKAIFCCFCEIRCLYLVFLLYFLFVNSLPAIFIFHQETALHVNSGLCIEIRHPVHWLSCSYFGVSFCASMELNLVEAMMCKDAKPTNASL